MIAFILVQFPAPVYDIQVKPSDTSAELTWKIPEPKNSTYITHYNISIGQKPPQRISRETHGNKFTISVLKPNTTYTVEIQTEDGSGQKSKTVYKHLKTKEAGTAGVQGKNHH